MKCILGPVAFHFATHCNADQRTRNAATRCVLRAYKAAKCDCARGSGFDPAGGAYSAPPDSLRGPLRGREGEGDGRERELRGGEEKWRRAGREGKGRRGKVVTLMHSWNRAADWRRPALRSTHKFKQKCWPY